MTAPGHRSSDSVPSETTHNHYGATTVGKVLPSLVAETVNARIVVRAACQCGKAHRRGEKCAVRSARMKLAWETRRARSAGEAISVTSSTSAPAGAANPESSR